MRVVALAAVFERAEVFLVLLDAFVAVRGFSPVLPFVDDCPIAAPKADGAAAAGVEATRTVRAAPNEAQQARRIASRDETSRAARRRETIVGRMGRISESWGAKPATRSGLRDRCQTLKKIRLRWSTPRMSAQRRTKVTAKSNDALRGSSHEA